MHAHVTRSHHVPRIIAALAATVIATLAATQAQAQVNPSWDHYKLYQAITPIAPPPFPVLLTDQFGPPTQHNILPLELWMNPVEKRLTGGAVLPINDPITH